MKRLLTALMCVVVTWSCADSPGPTLPSAPAPAPTPAPAPAGPPLTVSGVVRDKTSRHPVDGVTVDAQFVDRRMNNRGVPVHVVTDAAGMYTISSFPEEASSVRIGVNATDGRYLPAIISRELQSGDTPINFDVEDRKTYTLSGVVFETGPGGPVPVEGAVIEAAAFDAFECATYTLIKCSASMSASVISDANGHYNISGMWAGVETSLWILKAHYHVDGERPAHDESCEYCDRRITASGDMQLDIPLVQW